MPTGTSLRRIAKARLRDAEVLFNGRRYHGSLYLCGYAVELALKAVICRTLHWQDYLTSRDYTTFKTHDLDVLLAHTTFKTHDLDVLLALTGRARFVKRRHAGHWSVVMQWKPERRYDPIGSVTRTESRSMIASTKHLLDVL
jgi:HEPN domain-containing protein